MTDKEKLEEMKNKVTGLTDSEGYFADVVSMDVGVYAWFYKQAERVQELENMLNTSMYINRELRKENRYYREQLELIRNDTFATEEDEEHVSVKHLIRKRVDKALEDSK